MYVWVVHNLQERFVPNMTVQEATEVVEGLMHRCLVQGKWEPPTETELHAMWITNLVCVKLYQDRSIWLVEANTYVAEVTKDSNYNLGITLDRRNS
jgi:hypothetical protein